MKHISNFIQALRRRGLGYLGYLVVGYFIPRLSYKCLALIARIGWRRLYYTLAGTIAFMFVGFLTLEQGLEAAGVALVVLLLLIGLAWWVAVNNKKWRLRPLQRQAREMLRDVPVSAFTDWDSWPVDTVVRSKVDAALEMHPGRELVLGRVDNDGRLLGRFGPLPGWTTVTDTQFVPRYRFPLDIVLLDGKVLVRKDFRGDRERFIREWYNLTVLMRFANVPAVYRVNENQTLLYKNLIVGKTVRDVLVDAGANILNAQTDDDSELAPLGRAERLQAILARGTKILPQCFPDVFFQKLEDQMDAIHRCGVAGLSLTFGNIIVDENDDPWFLDFEGAKAYRSTKDVRFLWQRDQDRVKFNRIYARDLMTEKKARAELERIAAHGPGWYAPIDFGGGLTVNGFWTVDSGTGRWEYLNHRVLAPLVKGKRILDLGSNNGVMPLMMLRDGAREVVGLELDPHMVERARVVHRIFEWRDMCKYPFTLHTRDMRAILDTNWGAFDLITAFCSLYYLTEEDMAHVVRRAAELAPIMILQAKTDTRPEAKENKAEKSSLPFLKRLLEENGFPYVKIHAPRGYSRPLLVGKVKI